MAAGDDQANARINISVRIRELAGVEMSFEVIDGDERHVERQRQRLCRSETDDQGPHQARTGRDRDGPDPVEPDPRAT